MDFTTLKSSLERAARGNISTMSKQRILIVDDEPNIVLSLDFLMRQAGFEVETVSDGEQALAAVARQAPDLILLDVNMPKVNGYQVCEQVKGNPETAGVRIIMLTAKGRDIEREKGLAMGADGYLTKPFATQEVVSLAKEMLSQ
jgi:DNA-binding response OmpR family regulator